MTILFLKGSFEDEGLRDFEAKILSAMAAERRIPLAFKIGGCEAKTDIETSLNYGAQCIVAPMVESAFAAEKFVTATEPWLDLLKERNINIETITAVDNVEDILKQNHKYLNGIVVGRTDLALSMGLSKSMVDSDIVMEQVEKTLTVAKKYNLVTTMGGSVNTNSAAWVSKMHQKGLLDRFETRKVIMKASSDEKEILTLLEEAFEIETTFLDRTLVNYHFASKAASDRTKAIKERRKP